MNPRPEKERARLNESVGGEPTGPACWFELNAQPAIFQPARSSLPPHRPQDLPFSATEHTYETRNAKSTYPSARASRNRANKALSQRQQRPLPCSMGSTAALLTGLNSFNSSTFHHDELHSSDLDSVDSAPEPALLIQRDPAPAGQQHQPKRPVMASLNADATGRPGPSGRNGKPAARTGGGGGGIQRAASAMTLKEQESVRCAPPFSV